MARRFSAIALLISTLILGLPQQRIRAEDATPAELRQIRNQIQAVKANEQRQRLRDEQLIEQLQQRLDRLENQNRQLQMSNQALQASSQKLQQASEQLTRIQAQSATGSDSSEFAQDFHNYLGEHQFTLAGAAAGDFMYDRQSASNTFSLEFEPIILYRLNDWILFEGTIEADLPVGSNAQFQLPVATAQIFLNDYMELMPESSINRLATSTRINLRCGLIAL